MSPMLERAEMAAYAALEKEASEGGCYVGNVADEGFGDTVVEGVFSLERVVRAVLLAVREPDDGMTEAARWHADSDSIFTAMIDAILSTGEPS